MMMTRMTMAVMVSAVLTIGYAVADPSWHVQHEAASTGNNINALLLNEAAFTSSNGSPLFKQVALSPANLFAYSSRYNKPFSERLSTRTFNQDEQAEEYTRTLWLGYNVGGGLNITPLSYELLRGKLAYEIGAASADTVTGSAVSIALAANSYMEPGCGGTKYQGAYFTLGVSYTSVENIFGNSVTVFTVSPGIGFRFNFNRFTLRLNLGAVYISGNAEVFDRSLSGSEFVFPAFGGGIGYMF
jgi:hypothetical protein